MLGERTVASRIVFGACLVVFSAWVLQSPAIVKAQVQTTTAISGTVTDPTGAVIPHASVTVKNQGTGAIQAGAANSSGFYSFPSLAPGTYTVTVSHLGFEVTEVRDRVVQVAQPALVDVTLRVGSTAQTVSVTAAGAELISTSTAEISANVSSTLVREIPLISRNFMDLAALTPGVMPQNLSTGETSIATLSLNFVQAGSEPEVASGVFVSGNHDVSANVSIDGSTTESPIYNQTVQLQSPEDIQEMRVESANMNAEFGNGLSAVNIITKSGTNAFHGDVYEFLRNNHLDSADFFTNLAQQTLPNFQQNQFGFTLGGPIKKNKLLFFGNYEGYRLREADFSYEAVPTDSLRNGDFSNYQPVQPDGTLGPTPTIYNPYSYDSSTGLRQPFPGNVIPQGATSLCAPRSTCVDPAALAFLQKWVRPVNAIVDFIPVATADTQTWIDRNQGTVRLDWNESPTSNIYGRWTDFRTTDLAGGVQPLEGTESPYREQNIVIHWTKAISPTKVNDLMVSYARPGWDFDRKVTGVPNVSEEIGVHNTSALPGGPIIDLGEFTMDPSTEYAWTTVANKIQIKDDFRLVKSRHNMAFGGEVINDRFVFHNLADDKGEFTYYPQFTAACPAGNDTCAALGPADSGMDYADYLLGGWQEQFLQVSAVPYAGHQTYLGFYGQDSWRLTSKFNVNYGLRYEYWTPWLVPRNTTVGFDFQTGTIHYALQNPLDYLDPTKCYGECAPLNANTPRSSYTTGNRNFAPRIGIAYQATPNTTVRSAFGVYYDDNVNMVLFTQSQSGAAPFFLRDDNYQESDMQLPTLLMSQAFPAAGPTAIPTPYSDPLGAFRYVARHYPTPGLYQWSFSVQQRLGSSWSLEANYIGSHTVHLLQYINSNSPALPQGALADATIQQRRAFPGWSTIGTWLPIGWGKYEALQVSVKNNPWHGVSLITNFTWAKNLITGDPARSDQDCVDFRNPYIWAGPADFTPARYFVAGYNYVLPVGNGKALGSLLSPVLNKVASGWTFSGITRFSTGSPSRVLGYDNTGGSNSSGNADLTQLAGCNPNEVPGGRNRFEWFNTACFTEPPYGTFGNSTLGAITEPGINNWDLSLTKVTRTGFPKESGEVQFRAEFFNAFNHTQWGQPSETGPTSYSSYFGWITSTRPSRMIQFGLKFIF